MPVEKHRQGLGIGDDPSDVGGGRKAADFHWAIVVGNQLTLEVGFIDTTVRILVDDHHMSDGLAPGQLIGMMFVGSYENHRPFIFRNQ